MDATKKELKEAKKNEMETLEKNQKRQSIIKWLIISISSFLFLAFFVFIIAQAKQAKNSQKLEIPVTSEDHIRGDKNAKLTLVEFSDFQCPACAAIEPLTEKLLKDYPKDVRLVYKYFPLAGHPNSLPAAKSAEAAARQGKFWEMHDILFKKQDEWSGLENPQELYKVYSRSIKLNDEQFAKDTDSKDVQDRIDRDYNLGITVNIQATPTFFLNGEELTIANYSDFKKSAAETISIPSNFFKGRRCFLSPETM